MAKRASLSFDALKGSKATPATGEGEAPRISDKLSEKAEAPAAPEKRGRGRPAKRPTTDRTFGMTLRIPGNLRRAMRRLAEDETDAQGRVVSIHDIILQAVEAHLVRKGVKVED
jgi:hypothetical protein